ncbi:mechanosensitive ion channel [Flammeovirga sp. MY04]|uniref:mechanosensitive ion channel domain-containing protein n=1 Tax=Flammeovirga sp. MY04 TaxID=1191459 RepID=UPI0008062258|nr:mechanosensitive ion channel domain-containing protein [Flammeovirga sp. MY04]ANQ51462.1 mechanosensitive ion channel [Flammeovirga sp. MY04]
MTSIFTIIGVAFFAQWSHQSNITAGVIIFLTSPLKIGDQIRIYEGEGIHGAITGIGLFFTTIITEENQRLMLTNTAFMQKLWSVKISTLK